MTELSELLETIRAAEEATLGLPGRPSASWGGPGGLVELGSSARLVVVGDLHASKESYEAILGAADLEEGLASNRDVLVFLGDIVHDDRPGHLDKMASSIELLIDLCRLIAHYPGRVIWLRGNHDGFDPFLTKGWVRQGELFRLEVEKRGGTALRNAIQALFDALPLAALSNSLVLTHAGPPRGGMRREDIVEASPGSRIEREMVWNRFDVEDGLAGCYSRRDLERSLENLGCGEGASFVVGHNPLWGSGNRSGLWADIGMRGHHILYSGALGASPWLCHEDGRLSARFARAAEQ